MKEEVKMVKLNECGGLSVYHVQRTNHENCSAFSAFSKSDSLKPLYVIIQSKKSVDDLVLEEIIKKIADNEGYKHDFGTLDNCTKPNLLRGDEYNNFRSYYITKTDLEVKLIDLE